MAQERTDFIAGKMNKSVDERLIPKGEYIDALNVRLGSTENTEIGAVENSKGNTILTDIEFLNLPLSAEATTIGVYEDGIKETIYWFVTDDSNANSPTGKVDLILSYNTNSGATTYHVVSTSVLNFNKKYLITGVSKIENLLFFTDGINPPRVINIARIPSYGYPVGGIDSVLVEEDISVIVKPPGFEDYGFVSAPIAPLGAPHIEPFNIAGQENYMETRFISFAYRYRYEDGGYSATSLFTNPAFQPQEFRFSLQDYSNAGMINKYNACNVYFSTGSRRVTEVDLLYKQSSSNVIYVIKRYNKKDLGWPNDSFTQTTFTNSEIYTTLGSDELLRLYDNVPRIAQAQTIQGNRLMYGNYTDGYDIQAIEGGLKLELDYNTNPKYIDLGGTDLGTTSNPSLQTALYTIGPGSSVVDSKITWDLTAANNLPAPIVAGTTFNFIFAIQQSNIICSSAGLRVSSGTTTNILTGETNFTTVSAGNLSDGSFNFNTVGVLVGAIISKTNATLEAEVTSVLFAASGILGITDIDAGAVAFFEQTQKDYVIQGNANVLTDNNANFVAAGVSVGDIITVDSGLGSGLTATVSGSITATTLGITDIDGGLYYLERSARKYTITNGTVIPPSAGWSCSTDVTHYEVPQININMTFTCGVDYADVDAMCASQEFKDRIGGSAGAGYSPGAVVQELYPCNNSVNGGTLSDRFYAANPAIIPSTELVLINGSRTNTCANPTPFPLSCSTTVIASGQTDASALNTLTDSTATFVADGIAVGDIVMDMSSGLTAKVILPITATTLGLTDINGGLAELSSDPTDYQIVDGSQSASSCSPDGFVFSTVSGGFSLEIPGTQYYYAENTSSFSTFIYYQFIGYECGGSFRLTETTESLHSNRDYETGIVYMDEYGRSSTVLVSPYNTTFFPPSSSVTKNSIEIRLANLPPYWASKYKFVVKPSEGDYQTIYASTFYSPDGDGSDAIANSSIFWFKLEGNNQNLVSIGQELIVKVDSTGPLLTEQICTVLDIKAFPKTGITGTSSAGLYMQLKPSGWTTVSTQTNYFAGEYSKVNESTAASSQGGSCLNNYPLNDSAGAPYDIPAGSVIRIVIDNWRAGSGATGCNDMSVFFDKTFTSSSDYLTFHDWAVGDDLESQLTTANSTVDQMTISFDPALSTSGSGCISDFMHVTCNIRQTPNGEQFFVNSGGGKMCWQWFKKQRMYINTTIEVTRGGGFFVWETIPQDADPNLFYDASDLLEIKALVPGGQKYHMANTIFNPITETYNLAPGGTDQGVSQDLVTDLTFYNCYTFGNGVESYRIEDSPVGKSFNLGERTLAVSNQDFKEANRFAGMTYSGVYSDSANLNNLNEFNLGLLNYRDYETSFGPIQLLHSRETDILCLQEDRISYLLVKKNIIVDATGGGAIASVPQILGNQVARIEEYGISFNPESFVAWGHDMFFTDAKRGAVLNLRGASKDSDQLQIVSSYGMHSWFRNQFNEQLTTQKLGGYDPYMQEYVLSTNPNPVPVPIPLVPCGQSISKLDSVDTITYTSNLGLIVGEIDIPYTITSGSITINVTWDGTVYTSGAVTSSGSFTFSKTSAVPSTAVVEIIPTESSTYEVTVECPPEIPLTVIQVVVNSPNYSGETITTSYRWENGAFLSPYAGLLSNLTTTQPSEYQAQTGFRSLGVFPYSGSDIVFRTQKIAPNDFNFDPDIHKFRILSSPNLYTSSATDINTLLTTAPQVSGGIINTSAGVYQATQSAFSMPLANDYLYLIWDLRFVNSQNVCNCATEQEACCDCNLLTCHTAHVGPKVTNELQACFTDTNSPGNIGVIGFNSDVGGLPVTGDVCYNGIACIGIYNYLPSGFYVVGANVPIVGVKNWIQVGANGLVIDSGQC